MPSSCIQGLSKAVINRLEERNYPKKGWRRCGHLGRDLPLAQAACLSSTLQHHRILLVIIFTLSRLFPHCKLLHGHEAHGATMQQCIVDLAAQI
jgi:hypothetical protein